MRLLWLLMVMLFTSLIGASATKNSNRVLSTGDKNVSVQWLFVFFLVNELGLQHEFT